MKHFNVLKRILHFFNLEAELENPDTVFEEIKKGIVFKGTNLWILIFAIVVASVGLNMNSTAVIIGAMLISPLMGPINGMGYSIATYDLDLFRKSVKNFTFAIVASLVASTTYFALSPISTAHSELLARTSPSIYDVLIALFGGLAGIVAISSKQKGNVIPGVAIATALMPPLCTAGYGLATRQFDFFFGALYLFTINTIFIAIASVWISQLLKFPIRGSIPNEKKKRIERYINAVIVIVLLPSLYFGYKLVRQEEFQQRANQYVLNVSHFEGRYLLNNQIDSKSRKIVLVYAGTKLNEDQKNAIIQKSSDFNLSGATIVIQQGLIVGNLNDENLEMYKLRAQISDLTSLLKEKNMELDSVMNLKNFGGVILNEIKTVYPQIQGCSYSESFIYHDTTQISSVTPVVVLLVNGDLEAGVKTKIGNWLKVRLNNAQVKVLYEKTLAIE